MWIVEALIVIIIAFILAIIVTKALGCLTGDDYADKS